MEIGKLWKVLLLLGLGLVLLSNYPFIENKELLATSLVPSFITINPALVTNTKHTVIIKGMTFDPAVLHVRKGDTVQWVNKDIVPHNITDFPDAKWTSGTLALGSSWKKEINVTFDYYCSIHPTMKGKIIVDP